MRSGRNTFLASVAALALVAGAGLTWAQAAPDQQDHKGATTVKEPNAAARPMTASPMKGSAAAQRPQMNRSAQDEKRGTRGGNHAAETKPSQPGAVARGELKKSEKSAMTPQEYRRSARTAEERHHRTARTAEERHRMRDRATASRENRGTQRRGSPASRATRSHERREYRGARAQ